MPEGTGHPTGSLSPEETAKRAETRAKNAADIAIIAKALNTLKNLPTEFIDAIKRQVKLDNRRQPNNLFNDIIKFICGEKVARAVDNEGNMLEPPGKGKVLNDMELFMAFRVAATDMRKVIYQGQEAGIWISETKKGRDTLYTFFAESEAYPASPPEGYPGPIRKERGKKGDE